MKTLLRFAFLFSFAGFGTALRAQAPVTVPSANEVFAALPDETVLIPALRAVICIPEAKEALAPAPAGATGFDLSRAPLVPQQGAEYFFALCLGKPQSFQSLGRIAAGLRAWLRAAGESFAVAYLPPQDITSGVIRLVVRRATLDGEVKLTGAKWFSESYYRAALPLQPGQPVDGAALRAGLERLNANPSLQVRMEVQPGANDDSTQIELVSTEQRPWRFDAGYDNSGTAVTGEHRVNAGITWANAFGRGDQLGYRFSGDSAFEHLLSHSANYATRFSGGRTLVAFGGWSRVESMLPPPLTQVGHTWNLGTRYTLPLHAPHDGWTQNLTFAADFKYSDNTLEFATIPITDNVTHVVQGGLTYSLTPALGSNQKANLALTLMASPGGLTSRNHGRYFDVSRPGAKASYAYGQIAGQYQRALPQGFSWSTSATAQFTDAALLGSEQLAGSGNAGVRGYRESTAFGDWGIVVNNELHGPGFSLAPGNDQVDLFAFADLASLNLNVTNESSDLRSLGVGLNYQWRRLLSVRATYGWQLKYLDHSGDKGRGWVSANFSF